MVIPPISQILHIHLMCVIPNSLAASLKKSKVSLFHMTFGAELIDWIGCFDLMRGSLSRSKRNHRKIRFGLTVTDGSKASQLPRSRRKVAQILPITISRRLTSTTDKYTNLKNDKILLTQKLLG